jgi:hypothetical protein
MPRHHNRNNVKVPFTAEEETAWDAQEAQEVIRLQAKADAEVQKETDKTTGNQKLLDLGLTQAEVDALTGQ